MSLRTALHSLCSLPVWFVPSNWNTYRTVPNHSLFCDSISSKWHYLAVFSLIYLFYITFISWFHFWIVRQKNRLVKRKYIDNLWAKKGLWTKYFTNFVQLYFEKLLIINCFIESCPPLSLVNKKTTFFEWKIWISQTLDTTTQISPYKRICLLKQQ